MVKATAAPGESHTVRCFGFCSLCCGDGGWVVRPSFCLSGPWQLASKFHWVVLDNGREEAGGAQLSCPKGATRLATNPLSLKYHKGLEFGGKEWNRLLKAVIVMELIFVPLNLQMKPCVSMASLSPKRASTHKQQVAFITGGRDSSSHPVAQEISPGWTWRAG